jgi:PAS domain S-box-containing protein
MTAQAPISRVGMLPDRPWTAEMLRESATQLQWLFDHNPQPMWFTDLETLRFLAVNDAAIQLYGYSGDEFVTMTLRDISPPEDMPGLLESITKPAHGVDRVRTRKHFTKDGTLLEVELTSHTVSFAGRRAALVLAHDITERRRAERSLKESEDHYRAVVENVADAIVITVDTTLVFANKAFLALHGLADMSQALGSSIEQWIAPSDAPLVKERMVGRRRGDPGASVYEYRIRSADGDVRTVQASSVAITHKGEPAVLAVLRDITDRKHAETALRRAHEELERGVQERTVELSRAIEILQEQIAERHKAEDHLRRSQEQLHALSNRLLSILEEERIRIARETHDELGQALTALKIALAWIRQRLPADQKPVHDKADQMAHLIDTTVQAIRRIATELRPRVLDDLGLVAALEWHVREFQERTGVACAFTTSPEDIVVDPGRATTLFRICQEALTNVARHANATRIDLSLTQVGGALCLEVRDDGRGISEEAVTGPKSLGLMGMRERVLPWGGMVDIRGIQGKGTVVSVRIPLGKEEVHLSGASL